MFRLRHPSRAARRREADAFALAMAILKGRDTMLVASTSADARLLYARAREILRVWHGYVTIEWECPREATASCRSVPSPAPEPTGRLVLDALAARAYDLRHPVTP